MKAHLQPKTLWQVYTREEASPDFILIENNDLNQVSTKRKNRLRHNEAGFSKL